MGLAVAIAGWGLAMAQEIPQHTLPAVVEQPRGERTPGSDVAARWQRLPPVRVALRDAPPPDPPKPALPPADTSQQQLPPDFAPWWSQPVTEALRSPPRVLRVAVDPLVLGALQYCPRVLALKTEADSRRTWIAEEQAEFDWRSFAESKYDDLSDPVGSLLTTGGPTRFRDHNWSANSGVRRKNPLGGSFEVSEKIGYQDNNSLYFVPTQQGSARLQISYTQPLLNAAGQAYNESRIVLARMDADTAQDELRVQLETHLLKVTETYWNLYRARALHLQKERVLRSAVEVLEMLEARQHVDAVQNQILRARAAVASRRAEIARARTTVLNTESQLRFLVNDPQLTAEEAAELIPAEPPFIGRLAVSLGGSVQTALRCRPDVARALREVQAAGVRLGVARKDLLPKLDAILSAYSAGLEGHSEIGKAIANQFTVGEPGYSVGLVFEFPWGNQAALSRLSRRQLEARKTEFEMRSTLDAAKTEATLAVREVETCYDEMVARYHSMLAGQEEESYLAERWRRLPNYDRSNTQLLEDLLDAQERLAVEEAAFVSAQVDYVLSLAYLKRAVGTLLQVMDDGPQTVLAPRAEPVPVGDASPAPAASERDR